MNYSSQIIDVFLSSTSLSATFQKERTSLTPQQFSIRQSMSVTLELKDRDQGQEKIEFFSQEIDRKLR